MHSLHSKTILITGSSRGIGSATAKLAHSYGAKVILHGKTASDELLTLSEGLNAPYIICDISDREATLRAIGSISEPIDVLIHSAGVVEPKPFLETTTEDWTRGFGLNLFGAVYACQAVIPGMQTRGYGRIVLISSIRGMSTMASARGMVYSAAKASIMNLVSSLSKEFTPHISVNAVAPGFIETDIAKTWNESVWNQSRSNLLKRTGKPEEIAETLLFLASDHASFITGQTILVDGGYEMAGK